MIKTIQLRNLAISTVAVLLTFAVVLPGLTSAQEEIQKRGQSADVAEKVAERKEAAMAKVEEKRETAQAKSQEARTAACERRTDKLISAMSRISTQATKHVGTFDSIYERVQGFYDKGQLTIANYDELNAAVAEAQSTAQLEVGILAELNVEIDCEDPNVAGTVTAFKDSTTSSKDALKAYKSSLVSLISSLKASAAEKRTQDNSDVTETDATEPEETTTEETN
jgi:hypothetical protein